MVDISRRDVPGGAPPGTPDGPLGPAAATPRCTALPPAPAPAGRAAAAVTVTARRLRIDQGIAQAGVRDADALSRRLETGVSGADLRPGTLTAADLGPS